MQSLSLPLSKSLVARLLILEAVHGDRLIAEDINDCNDVRVLRRALVAIRDFIRDGKECRLYGEPIPLHLSDSGTALRFLSAYVASIEGFRCILTGSARLCQRPIKPLLDVLVSLGAKVSYMGEEGFAPFCIEGAKLAERAEPIVMPTTLSTQFASALLLIGQQVVPTEESPYIRMTRVLVRTYAQEGHEACLMRCREADWSAAAFWLEYAALHEGEFLLRGLTEDSLQGDAVARDLFAHLGVVSEMTADGLLLRHRVGMLPERLSWDFHLCPDLYPAAAVTCHQLGVRLEATGIEALRYKESDRQTAVSEMLRTGGLYRVRTCNDHRIAMAAIVAGWQVDTIDCIAKSYPDFPEHYRMLTGRDITADEHQQIGVSLPLYAEGQPQPALIIARRGVNDEGMGKKHALHRLVAGADTEYVLFRDDDISPSPAVPVTDADMLILPLMMKGGNSLIERLQRAEYAAIQEVTYRTALRGKAVMCSGANLLVRRARWLESWCDLQPDIPSGDDMFLLESFRRRGLKIAVTDDPRYTAAVQPLQSWRALMRQRMRWAGKAPRYTDRYIRRYGALVLTANILQLFCPLILLIKFPYEYALIKKRDPRVPLLDALLLELIYPLYVVAVVIGGLFRRNW